MNILIKNARLITFADDNVISNGIVLISGDEIIYAGKYNDNMIESFKIDRLIDANGDIVMPGFVNSHTHTPMTLLRNYGNDLNLQQWLFEKIFPKEALLKEDDIYWASLMAMAEMISSGTTAFNDMYYMMDYVAKAAAETGMRATLNCEALSNSYLETGRKSVTTFDRARAFINRWNGYEARINVYTEIHSTYLYDLSVLPEALEFAAENNTGIHIHLHETLKEVEECIDGYGNGKTPIEVCSDMGMFKDFPVLAAHCVHLNDNDLDILVENDVNVAHNPSSNLKLASGIADIPKLLEKGINVCIGTDGASSNNNLNMIKETHLAAIVHKGNTGDPTVINALTALKMGTVNGAKGIGFGDKVGIIEKGKKADLIILDTNTPNMLPVNDPVAAVAYSAQGYNVKTVIINGNIVYDNREFKTLDLEKVKYNFNKSYDRLFKE